MSRGFAVVIGMTIAYAASLAGMIFAYIYYRRYKRDGQLGKNEHAGGPSHV